MLWTQHLDLRCIASTFSKSWRPGVCWPSCSEIVPNMCNTGAWCEHLTWTAMSRCALVCYVKVRQRRRLLGGTEQSPRMSKVPIVRCVVLVMSCCLQLQAPGTRFVETDYARDLQKQAIGPSSGVPEVSVEVTWGPHSWSRGGVVPHSQRKLRPHDGTPHAAPQDREPADHTSRGNGPSACECAAGGVHSTMSRHHTLTQLISCRKPVHRAADAERQARWPEALAVPAAEPSHLCRACMPARRNFSQRSKNQGSLCRYTSFSHRSMASKLKVVAPSARSARRRHPEVPHKYARCRL